MTEAAKVIMKLNFTIVLPFIIYPVIYLVQYFQVRGCSTE